jgi:hypothetical protein
MEEERALTESEYGVTFVAFSSFPLPLPTELANKSNSGMTGELLFVFIHGIGTRWSL